MLNVDSQDWWMWQMYRATAEFMHEPNHDREAQLKFFMHSYRYFHQQQNEIATANLLEENTPLARSA